MNKPSLIGQLAGGAAWVVVLAVVLGEYLVGHPPDSARTHLVPILMHGEVGFSAWYGVGRAWVCEHWLISGAAAFVGVGALVLFRTAYQWWHNVVLARLTGTDFGAKDHSFPKLDFPLLEHLAATPRGSYFLGLSPRRKPVVIEEGLLNTHLHAVGPTGTGKTESLLFPLLLQDARAGKGAVFIDAKGAYSNIERFKTIAAIAGRARDVRIFSLEYPEACNSYNPVHLGPKGDPLTTAERVFSDFRMDNEYYRGQAKLFFYNLVRLMAGTGKAFNLTDIRLVVGDDEALAYVMDLSDEHRAKHDISKQLSQLGKKRYETFTGLYNALADYDPGGAVSDALNSYNPDIVVEDVLNERQLVYFHLPANRFQLLAPSIGKIMLRHLASVGAARDARPKEYDQTPFSVSVDECHQFVFESLLMSLTMLRSAKMQFRLAHQTLAQLEAVSPAFERTVRTNTRCKVLFFSDDPDHLELVSRSYGTTTTYKKTIRYSVGPLWTHINSGEASNREVQEIKIHPDALKGLAECGQGYLLLPRRVEPLSFAMLPELAVPDYPLRRKPQVEGLDLYGKFVKSAVACGKP